MNEQEQEQGDLLDCNTWEQLWRTEIEKERTGNWEPSSFACPELGTDFIRLPPGKTRF